jgi:anthranilate synthase component 1
MNEPSFERYVALVKERGKRGESGAQVVPVSRDIPFDSGHPVSAFEGIRRGPFAFLLESAPPGGDTWARFTFMGTEPHSAWRLRDGIVEDWEPHRGWHSAREPADPLADFEEILAAFTPVDAPGLGPFWNGAVGFFGYDIVRLIEKLPARPRRTSSVPDALFIFTRSVVIVDSVTAKARVVIATRVPPEATDADLRHEFDLAVSEIAELERRILQPPSIRIEEPDHASRPATGKSSIDREEFIDGVDRIKEYIRAGDCFQALLSRRIELEADFDPDSLYRALRALNPSPYMYHLAFDGIDIVGSSPELLVRLENERVTLRPIAGTRPRGSTPARDEELGKELLADPKELAEHIMLVDLGRNDVGRIARYGTVEVTELMKIEKYSHVLHIVSQVEGELAGEASAMDVLRATFPAGTMTGAPKVRAMEIIDELEPVSRGAYAGALGYIAGGGKRMDLAITIRTCVIADGVASVQAGAGIVADSIGENEWEETESKARAVLSAIGRARRATR